MAFASTITDKTVFGNKRRHSGTFSCASVAGGDIDTGLRRCDGCKDNDCFIDFQAYFILLFFPVSIDQ